MAVHLRTSWKTGIALSLISSRIFDRKFCTVDFIYAFSLPLGYVAIKVDS